MIICSQFAVEYDPAHDYDAHEDDPGHKDGQ